MLKRFVLLFTVVSLLITNAQAGSRGAESDHDFAWSRVGKHYQVPPWHNYQKKHGAFDNWRRGGKKCPPRYWHKHRKKYALFEPLDNKVLLFVGQDLGAIGGMDAEFTARYDTVPFIDAGGDGWDGSYTDGYMDMPWIPIPAGFTTYTSTSFTGIAADKIDYGAGDVSAQMVVDHPMLPQGMLAIGFYMVDQTAAIAKGDFDENIREMCQWIMDQNVPVLLRIGYEFNPAWTHYDPVEYIAAYRHIVDIFRDMGCSNCAFVWQSDGGLDVDDIDGDGLEDDLDGDGLVGDDLDADHLLKWYPGDDYVDWLGYSHFDGTGVGILEIARKRKKPVFVAEATPVDIELDEISGEEAWEQWFQPFFEYIDANRDVIKAISYINVDWPSQAMWVNDPFWMYTDSRIQANDYVRYKWMETIYLSNRFLLGKLAQLQIAGWCEDLDCLYEDSLDK